MPNKPSIKVLKESAEKWGAEIAGGSIKAAVDGLHDFFVNKCGESNLAQCPVCKNDGPEKDDDEKLVTHCPYCGQKFSSSGAEEKPKDKKTSKVRKKKGAEKEDEKEYIATVEQKAELAEHVDRLTELRQSMAQNAWEIGTELVVINDNALWRGLGYETFFAYCQGELDFSRASAYKYMLCSREFDQTDFASLGVKKGELIAAAPEKHRRKLMNSAKKGSSFTDLKARLNKLEGKSGGGGADKSKGMTLLGRVKDGDIEIDWVSTRSHKPVTKPGVKGRYARLKITDEIELVLIPTENEMAMIANFRKISDEPSKEEGKDENKGEDKKPDPSNDKKAA